MNCSLLQFCSLMPRLCAINRTS